MATGKLKDHQLEKKLGDHARAVVVRRSLFERRIGRSMENLPVEVRKQPAVKSNGMVPCLVFRPSGAVGQTDRQRAVFLCQYGRRYGRGACRGYQNVLSINKIKMCLPSRSRCVYHQDQDVCIYQDQEVCRRREV